MKGLGEWKDVYFCWNERVLDDPEAVDANVRGNYGSEKSRRRDGLTLREVMKKDAREGPYDRWVLFPHFRPPPDPEDRPELRGEGS